jgi:hypothetical protein
LVDTHIKRIQLLDRLYDFRPRRRDEMAFVANLIDPPPDDHQQDLWRDILHQLADSGSIVLAESMSFDGTSVSLLGPGRAEVEERRKRRGNPGLRSAAARDAVLRWISANPGRSALNPMSDDSAYFFEGAPLQRHDLGSALSYLHKQGLVEGTRFDETTLMNAKLTDKGRDCIDNFGGSVSDSMRSTQGGGNTTHNIHFNGPVSGNVAWSNQTVTQSATTSGVAGEELMVLIRAVAQSVQALDLPRQDAEALGSHLQVVEGELRSGHPDQNIVATFMGRAMKTLGRQGGNALALVLGASTRALLEQMGLSTA